MTLPEVLLWQILRERPGDLRFRRQHPAGPYILDFYCPSCRLAIEVDGEIHGLEDRLRRDAERDAWLAARGVRTIRIPATEVLKDIDAVLRFILAQASIS